MAAVTGRVVTPAGVRRGVVLIEEGRIAGIAPTPDSAGRVYDFGECLIVPGFIDLHLHGLGEYGVYETDEILAAAALETSFGTTGFMPSNASLTEERYLEFGRNVRAAQQRAQHGMAAILGAHFEGPFVNPARKGAMAEGCLRPPEVNECRRYLAEAGDVLKLMTIAPELEGALDLIRLLTAHGVVASLGHSEIAPEDLPDAVEAGLTQVCHLFNTFEKPSSPEIASWPRSLLSAIVAEKALRCELICDLHHVEPELIKGMAKALAPDRFIAITDSMTGTGLPPSTYKTADGRAYTTGGAVARLMNGDIVGSTLTMNRAFGNLVEIIGLAPELAARFTAANAARAMGIDAEVGSIEHGKRADLAILNPTHHCLATFRNGELVYAA